MTDGDSLLHEGVLLTWLGQAGFRLELGGLRVLIDPFVSPHSARLHPAPDSEDVAAGVDWLLITHGHGDHLDGAFVRLLAARSPGASIVVPSALADEVAALAPGLGLVAVDPGDGVDLDADVRVSVTPAWHAEEVDDGYSDGRGVDGSSRFVGYVIGDPTVAVYHSGDTLATDGLRAALAPMAIDIALLPVNGRDERREREGIVGNMTGDEAVELAEDAGAAVLVPMHWDMLAGNTASPGAAADAASARALHVLVPARMKPIRLER